MPRSHPSYSPVTGSYAVIDPPGIESNAHEHHRSSSRHHHRSHSYHQQHHYNDNDMVVGLHSLELSSPASTSTGTSGRSSVDHTDGSINHRSLTGINFLAQSSEFVRSTQRDTSSDPVVETYINNDDYLLVRAASNIHVSHPQPRFRDTSRNPNSTLDTRLFNHTQTLAQSSHAIQGGQINEDDGENARHSESIVDNIYDLRHIMIHNQRQFERQSRQINVPYDQQIGIESIDRQSLDPTSPGASNEPITESRTPVRPPIEGPYHLEFDPRPTISSSYFPHSTESAIVLSSPPPGRSSGAPSYQPSDSAHSHITSLGHSLRNSNINTSGSYRPFVTGRDVALEQQQGQDPSQLNSSTPLSSARASLTDSMDNLENEGRASEEGGGQGGWSIYGSLAHRTNPFVQRQRQHYRQRQLESHRRWQETTVGDEVVPHTVPAAGTSNPQSSPLHSQSRVHSLQAPQANTSVHRHGSHIPIPSHYTNPHALSHPQQTSSTPASPPSSLFRPMSPSEHSDHRQPTTGRDQVAPRLPQRLGNTIYSETVERAEAGGWTPSSSSTGWASYSWRDSLVGSRARNNIGLKEVVRMACYFCTTLICERGMKAQLLADQSVALLSTDYTPQSVELIGPDYKPTNCLCRIKDTACLVCGNVIGYHITQPCEKCLSSDNNGHLWLFHPEYVNSSPRRDHILARPLRWNELPEPDQDFDTLSLQKVYRGLNGKMTLSGMVRREYDIICR